MPFARSPIIRQALSIAVALVPFAVAFGVAADAAGLSVLQALGFSTLVFSGSAQFAAVGVLADGGGVVAAVTAGALLNLRSLAFGVALAPALRGPLWWRALVAQLMIDESTAVATAQDDLAARRFGYLAGGLAVFGLWNLGTVLGSSVLAGAEDLVETAGIDATIPAAFLALVWPRLASREQRGLAVGGGVVAFLLAPVAPPGIPIIAAAGVVALARPWEAR